MLSSCLQTKPVFGETGPRHTYRLQNGALLHLFKDMAFLLLLPSCTWLLYEVAASFVGGRGGEERTLRGRETPLLRHCGIAPRSTLPPYPGTVLGS